MSLVHKKKLKKQITAAAVILLMSVLTGCGQTTTLVPGGEDMASAGITPGGSYDDVLMMKGTVLNGCALFRVDRRLTRMNYSAKIQLTGD